MAESDKRIKQTPQFDGSDLFDLSRILFRALIGNSARACSHVSWQPPRAAPLGLAEWEGALHVAWGRQLVPG